MDDLYTYNRGKKLKCGYTTGSCAAGASKAAVMMYNQAKDPEYVDIQTPAGITLHLKVSRHRRSENRMSCCIVKNSGDDIDSTDGIEVFAEACQRTDNRIVIEGGEGIGRITRSGFWGSVGESAINPVPRKMIQDEITAISDQGWNIVISVPGGEKLARKTLNSKLGIEGGISIIGTSGIVEPMSVEALKKTIYLEIDAISQQSTDEILLFLGNYGKQIAAEANLNAPSVKISNFIGDAVLRCKNVGFKKITLIGHIGKLCKLSIGAFYTHSSACDLRIESFIYYLAIADAGQEVIQRVKKCHDSEEALKTVLDYQLAHVIENMRQGCIDKIKSYVKDIDFKVDVILYSMEYGVLTF